MRRIIAVLSLAALLIAVPGVASAGPPAPNADGPTSETFEQRMQRCGVVYDRGDFRRLTRLVFDGRTKYTAGERKAVRRYVLCQGSPAATANRKRELRSIKRRHTRQRREWVRLGYWGRERQQLSPGDRWWAVAISQCESGRDPQTNTGNGFLGAHQWVLSTWHMAGGSGSPVNASLAEQDVRAVRWRNQAGEGQWPVCSQKIK